MPQCSHNGCENEATTHCVWGLIAPCEKSREFPTNNGDLCDDCAEVLWLSVEGAVNAGRMHWVKRALEVPVMA